MNRIYSFPPVIDSNSKILILGSVPGIRSLEMQQYYAHPQNKFWTILFEIFQEEFTFDYQTRIELLISNHIAVWDVIDSCERKGSLDSEILNVEENNIGELLKNFPNIKAIYCNGQKSFKSLNKILNQNQIDIFALSSTSPAYTISYLNKLEAWKIIKEYL